MQQNLSRKHAETPYACTQGCALAATGKYKEGGVCMRKKLHVLNFAFVLTWHTALAAIGKCRDGRGVRACGVSSSPTACTGVGDFSFSAFHEGTGWCRRGSRACGGCFISYCVHGRRGFLPFCLLRRNRLVQAGVACMQRVFESECVHWSSRGFTSLQQQGGTGRGWHACGGVFNTYCRAVAGVAEAKLERPCEENVRSFRCPNLAVAAAHVVVSSSVAEAKLERPCEDATSLTWPALLLMMMLLCWQPCKCKVRHIRCGRGQAGAAV
jgi:hypothetical protein